MKKIIVIGVAALLLLGGGGFGVWKFVLEKPPEPVAELPVAPPEPVYVDFNPIQLPIIADDNRVDQLINIVVVLQVADRAAGDQVIALAPRLNDAYIEALYGSLYANTVIHDGIMDIAYLKQRIVDISNRVVGEGMVVDALVQMVNQRLL